MIISLYANINICLLKNVKNNDLEIISLQMIHLINVKLKIKNQNYLIWNIFIIFRFWIIQIDYQRMKLKR
ncbi:MAG: hypothetical protein A2475_11585 [Ignavibacteria bacterium RIFOXYC2_FULL_35_21]|nr:MAG: hypothetical protein A2X63_11590 [Ignavibacteria bacterium GWA2_35_8]OGV20810.1 MAG: hypothetical protein A2475_11585 [Ignavibacteria bacterium RIFOXYC2_FULL_35_21]